MPAAARKRSPRARCTTPAIPGAPPGASRFTGANGFDVRISNLLGRPLPVEVKQRATGSGFRQSEGWLGTNDMLVWRRDRADPFAVHGAPVLYVHATNIAALLDASLGGARITAANDPPFD